MTLSNCEQHDDMMIHTYSENEEKGIAQVNLVINITLQGSLPVVRLHIFVRIMINGYSFIKVKENNDRSYTLQLTNQALSRTESTSNSTLGEIEIHILTP